MNNIETKTRKMIYVALIGAMTFVIAKSTRFPIFPTAPFLKMEFGEVPLIILTAFTSWKYGLLALLVKQMLSFTLTGTNILSLTADFVACGTWLLAFDLLYKKSSKLWLSVALGGILRMIIAIPLNFIILPLQYGSNMAVIMSQLVYILPFNFLKSALDGVCFKVLYSKLVKPLQDSFKIFNFESEESL